MTLGEFFQDLLDDASESLARIERERDHLREIGQRATFGLRIMKEVAKTEIEITADRVRDQMSALLTRGSRR